MNKIKLQDTVFVRSGRYRTKTGQVERIDWERRVAWVAGVNLVKRHQKKNARHPQGGIIEKHQPLALAKLMVVDPKSKRPTRVRLLVKGDNRLRVAQRSGEELVSSDNKTS